MITDYISIVFMIPPQGRLTGVKLGQEIHREYIYHSLHCVYPDFLLTFSHIIYLKNIWEPHFDGVII